MFNYLFAKANGGDFILRIEDTDSSREVDGSVDYLKRCLDWVGISFDESPDNPGTSGPYTQSERKDIYKKYVDRLIESGHAYYAFDTKEELAKMRDDLKAAGVKNTGYAGVVRDRMRNSINMSSDEVNAKIDAGDPYVVRFKMPRNEDVKFNDIVRGWVSFNTNSLDDKVIWKSSDGLPTYHLANVVDDYLMEITHVIRGEEWVSSTPLHVMLYRGFGWDIPTYAHLPLILGPNGKKLGKRNKYGIPVFLLDWSYTDPDGEAVDIDGFKEAGYESDSLINFLALLGWNPGDNVEFMTMDEMSSLFTLERVNKSGAMFDMKKLNAFNAHYLRSRDESWIIDKMGLPDDHGLSSEQLNMIATMATERAVLAGDLNGSMSYIFSRPTYDGELKLKNIDEFTKVMNIFAASDYIDEFDDEDWTSEHIWKEIEFIANNIDVKVGKVMPMLRLSLTGGVPGPQLKDIMYLLGRKETAERINAFLIKIKETA